MISQILTFDELGALISRSGCELLIDDAVFAWFKDMSETEDLVIMGFAERMTWTM